MIRLIHGNDTYSSLEYAKKLFKEEVAKQDNPETFNEDFSEKSIEEIFQILEGQTLFSTSKVALIKSLGENKRFKDAVDQLLVNFEKVPDSISILIWESKKVPSNTKYGKFFKAKKLEAVFEEKKKPEIKAFAKEVFTEKGLKIGNSDLDLFLFRINYNIASIVSEVEKLSLLDHETITTQDINEVVSNNNELVIWDLTDAITESDQNKALKAVEDLMKNESDGFTLIPMIGRQIKLMIQIKKALEAGRNYSEIASELRLPPFIVNKVTGHVRNMDLNKLKRLFIKLVDMDFAIKTGKMEPQIAMSLFCSLL